MIDAAVLIPVSMTTCPSSVRTRKTLPRPSASETLSLTRTSRGCIVASAATREVGGSIAA